jgi:hypothetical protein
MAPNISVTLGDENDTAGDDVQGVARIAFIENHFLRCHRLRMQPRDKYGEVLGR